MSPSGWIESRETAAAASSAKRAAASGCGCSALPEVVGLMMSAQTGTPKLSNNNEDERLARMMKCQKWHTVRRNALLRDQTRSRARLACRSQELAQSLERRDFPSTRHQPFLGPHPRRAQPHTSRSRWGRGSAGMRRLVDVSTTCLLFTFLHSARAAPTPSTASRRGCAAAAGARAAACPPCRGHRRARWEPRGPRAAPRAAAPPPSGRATAARPA